MLAGQGGPVPEQPSAAQQEPKAAVFLSYASEDAPAAERIATALRSAGIEVWFDRTELRGGDIWERQIEDRIHECRLFIPLISANTERRDEGYFRREWSLAVDRTRDMADKKTFLLPVVIDGTHQREASVPEKFRHVQWTRVPEGQASPDFVARIAALLGAERGTATPARPEPGHPQLAPGRPERPRLWPWLGVGLLLAALAIGAVAWRYTTRPPAAARGAGAARATEASIAVLPFVDLSEKHDQGYFADGLAEEIVDLLAKIPGLKVIGRTSSFQFRSNSGDLRKIGATLDASHIVEGSVRKQGNRVRVTVQLIDAADGTHRWSETYDRDGMDILSLQREIATAVARQLEVTVSDYFGPGGTTRSAEAYDLYLRGIRDVDSYNGEAVRRAIAAFSKAVEYDPTYVNAWVGLADAYDVAATMHASPYAEAYRQARLTADKALALDPRNADAYATRAFVRMNVWDWQGAEDDIRRSLDVRNSASGMQAAARLATIRGRLTEAEPILLKVLALDPLDTYTLQELAIWVYPGLGRFEEADRVYVKLKDLNPSYDWFNGGWAILKALQGNYPEALRLAQADPEPEAKEAALAIAYSGMGKPDQAKQALERLLKIPTASAYNIASVHAYRGEKDLAFRSLEAAYREREPDLVALKFDPLLESLRNDPRYNALVRRMNLPESP
jgi:TolB-like protein/tetratricopeptide (TPR) repeat protein